MLQVIIDYCVPANLALLMLVAGTEITTDDVRHLKVSHVPVAVGAGGQLLFLPLIALVIAHIVPLSASIAASTLLLALCPGGGIANYYCYVARANVLLSAMIAAVGTVMSLLTIPLWLSVLPLVSGSAGEIHPIPAGRIVAQLLTFMALPMAAGFALRRSRPDLVQRHSSRLRAISALLVVFVLGAAAWTIKDDLDEIAIESAQAATLFIAAAMLSGAAIGLQWLPRDRTVLVIESGVRNVAVALILGKALLDDRAFDTHASFLTVYFVIEIVMMMTFARLAADRWAKIPSDL